MGNGPGFYERRVFSPAMERILGTPQMSAERSRVLAAARGDILEVGIGTGLNLPGYPRSVQALTALGPDPRLDHRAADRARRHRIDLRYISGDAQAMSFPDDSFDTVVCTFVLCSLPRPDEALAEFARVLRPGGALIFLEHVGSPSPLVRRLQTALNPAHRLIACGCRIDRQTDELLRAGPIELEELVVGNVRGTLWPYRRVIRGTARA